MIPLCKKHANVVLTQYFLLNFIHQGSYEVWKIIEFNFESFRSGFIHSGLDNYEKKKQYTIQNCDLLPDFCVFLCINKDISTIN